MKQFYTIEEVFDQIEDSFNMIARDLNGTYASRVVKNGSQSYITKTETIPHVDSITEITAYKSRYTHFMKWMSNIVYGNYSPEKRNGFETAINRYIELAKKDTSNLKAVEIQLSEDLAEYEQRVVTGSDLYLTGYKDALNYVKKVINQTKVTRFQELANKIK